MIYRMFDLARGPGRLHGRLIVSVQVARFGEPGVMEVWSDGPTDSAQISRGSCWVSSTHGSTFRDDAKCRLFASLLTMTICSSNS